VLKAPCSETLGQFGCLLHVHQEARETEPFKSRFTAATAVQV